MQTRQSVGKLLGACGIFLSILSTLFSAKPSSMRCSYCGSKRTDTSVFCNVAAFILAVSAAGIGGYS